MFEEARLPLESPFFEDKKEEKKKSEVRVVVLDISPKGEFEIEL